jgi:RNA-directed DNA polymerase
MPVEQRAAGNGDGMNRPKQLKLALVPADRQVVQQAQQAGERRARWAWSEAQVWTNRMLEALEEGVKGGKWFRLIDKVYALDNLRAAWKKVQANDGAAGVDGQNVQAFAAHAETYLKQLAQELQEDKYRPLEVRRHWIPKPGSNEQRPLGIPAVRDRVVQTALRAVLEPIFEREFAEQSYGFRPGRSCKTALTRVMELLQQGHLWVVHVDLKSYFDTISHTKLLERVRERVADGRVLQLIEAFLKAHILDGLKRWEPETGTPQGAVVSPLLSNIYLNPLDHRMAQRGFEMVRYADDFVVLCRSEEEASQALGEVREWTVQAGLQLHPEKTRIVTVTSGPYWEAQGFDFLGFHFTRDTKTPRDKSLKKFRDAIRAKTPRRNGHCMSAIIATLNPRLRGWHNYFRASEAGPLRVLDQMIRRRLRAILNRRAKKKGQGRGWANMRWPNAYFKKLGLLSLLELRAKYHQSLRGTR